MSMSRRFDKASFPRQLDPANRPGLSPAQHASASSAGFLRNRVALLARRAVGDVAHRIDRLVGRPCGDQHAPPRPAGRSHAAEQRLARARRFPAARPCGRRRPRCFSAISPAIGADERDAVGGELRDVALVSPRWPTSAGFIAGASRPGRSVASRMAVARSSARPFAIFAIRSAVAGATTIRSHSRASRMWPGVELALGIEQIGVAALVGERAAAKRRDELLRGLRQHAANVTPRSFRRRIRSSDL